ncbi:hypothetical protein [Methylibium rhizosphaerae]|jgi:hypothetical protein|uniref:hypothetical protein n=1 Tax=Methylibium rhizosphaerae TaxID=2570323 RepID=UPI00112A1EC1|nr:hypothetical protein [Methylibium rhizosphaerae]
MASALAAAAARLSTTYAPGVWIGAVRRAFDADAHGHHPPHFLVALWEPLPAGQPLLPRWPAVAAIASPDANAALLELVRHLPAGARVWLCDTVVDWALISEIVLRSDRNLEPHHRAGLAAFAQGCRDADASRIEREYTDREPGFERFRDGLLGPDPGH